MGGHHVIEHRIDHRRAVGRHVMEWRCRATLRSNARHRFLTVIHWQRLATDIRPVTLPREFQRGMIMTDPLTTEAIYLRLGSLIADMPDIKVDPTPETHRWVAQVLALIEASKLVDTMSIATFQVVAQASARPAA